MLAAALTTAAVLAAQYVGSGACAQCHPAETQRWQGSHHDRAMEIADEHTVLGNFNDTTFTYAGTTSRFYRRDGKFFVHTDGPDGRGADYEVRYTFGVDPLQQYLLELPGGRYQALSIAWDSRPAAAGGQRWFHLYPDETITHTDPLHWTQPSQNWNDRCARCHSTDLEKRYRLGDNAYETTWAEIDVACESCHGPGAVHVARAKAGEPAAAVRAGLTVQLGDAVPATWEFGDPNGIARRNPPRTSHAEVETCAPCHARRAEISASDTPGTPLLDNYRPALLDEALYFADGQLDAEVYEYGSFLQSAMYRAGVTCSDCHDPHSLALRAEGNALCGRCHQPARFDTPEHHFHPAGSAGAQCVACHMPQKTYMVIDERHDHSFRVPRPDLDATLKTPDACTSCHRDRSSAWAAEAIARHADPQQALKAHWGETIALGRAGAVGGAERLTRLAGDAQAPAIARATAISLLRAYGGDPKVVAAIRAAAQDPDPLLRLAAVEVAEGLEPRAAVEIAGARLDDPIRTVRLGAASALAGIHEPPLSGAQQAALERAVAEYRAAQLANADRPESHLNLGVVAAKLGDPNAAAAALETALRLEPSFAPAYVNLADIYRIQRRDADGERVLRTGLARAPESAAIHHALGLLLVREQRLGEAVPELTRAHQLEPDNARSAYVLGVARHTTGDTKGALEILRAAQARRPADPDLLIALITISRDSGDTQTAQRYLQMLAVAAPWHPALR